MEFKKLTLAVAISSALLTACGGGGALFHLRVGEYFHAAK